jgi:hypothetical protein
METGVGMVILKPSRNNMINGPFARSDSNLFLALVN